MQPFAFAPPDRGDLDMPAIMRALAGIGFNGAMTAGLAAWPDPKPGAAICLAFLKEAGPA